ncbi:MAG: UvrB/UvrC motif-containing protein [Candidatus Krumholzibacteriia bacterium]
MSNKKCDLCEKNRATVHYTEIADAKVSKLFICRKCAASRGLLDEPAQALVGVEELMSTISRPPGEDDGVDLECPQCGLTFARFRKRGRLGCPRCYDSFERRLVPLLREIHKHERHTGKSPRSDPVRSEQRRRIALLRKELETAVRAEDYERAARLRDDIRTAEAQLGGQAGSTGEGRAPDGGPAEHSEGKPE